MADEKKAKKAEKADKKPEKKAAKKGNQKSNNKKSSKNPFKAIGGYFKSVGKEGKKVTWPKGKEVWKNTLVVLVVIIISGLIIFGIDRLLSDGIMANIKKAAENRTSTSVTQTTTEKTTAQALEESTTAAQTSTTAAETTTKTAE